MTFTKWIVNTQAYIAAFQGPDAQKNMSYFVALNAWNY